MSPSPSAAAANPDSPKNILTSPAAIPTSSLFLPPTSPAAALPPPSPSPSSSTDAPKSLLPPADTGEAPTWSRDSADSEATSSGPSESSDTPSTGSGISVSKAGLRVAIGRGLRTATGVVNRLASSPLEADFNVWRADDEDVRDISDPAARVIWRRVPAEARTGDMVDLVVLGLAVIGYVAKSLDRRATVRQMQSAVDNTQLVGDSAAP